MSQKFHKKYDSIACKNLKDAKDILKAIETVEDEVSKKKLFIFLPICFYI